MAAAVRELRAARARARDLKQRYLDLEKQLCKLRDEEREVTCEVERAWGRVRDIAEWGTPETRP